jgi:hypothetical protein
VSLARYHIDFEENQLSSLDCKRLSSILDQHELDEALPLMAMVATSSFFDSELSSLEFYS